jgi:hypothetical protein
VPPGDGGGNAVTGFDGADGGCCLTDFGVGGCGLAPGNCAPGVIPAEGAVGVEYFVAGVCAGGVVGFVLSPAAGEGTAGATAAEGIVGEGFAAVVCDGDVLRLVRPAGEGINGLDGAGASAAEGVVAAGVCAGAVAALAAPAGADDDVPGDIAPDGNVGVTALAAGACDGAGDEVLGVVAAEGAVGIAGLPLGDGSG